jgi:hypothetical protein
MAEVRPRGRQGRALPDPGGPAALRDGPVLSLNPRSDLAKDAGAHSVRRRPASSASDMWWQAESRSTPCSAKPNRRGHTHRPHDRRWGIYSGYIRCPDGHLWEILWNPRHCGSHCVSLPMARLWRRARSGPGWGRLRRKESDPNVAPANMATAVARSTLSSAAGADVSGSPAQRTPQRRQRTVDGGRPTTILPASRCSGHTQGDPRRRTQS